MGYGGKKKRMNSSRIKLKRYIAFVADKELRKEVFEFKKIEI